MRGRNPPWAHKGRLFVFRDLQLGNLSKEQVVATIVATNKDARVLCGGKLIYNFDYTSCVRADLQSRKPLIVRTVIETRCRATHLPLGQVVIAVKFESITQSGPIQS